MTQVFIRPLLRGVRLKSTKTIHHLIHLFTESGRICFISIAQTVCVSRALFLRCGKCKQDHYHPLSSTEGQSYGNSFLGHCR